MSNTVHRPTYLLGTPCGLTPTFEVYCHTSPSGKRYIGWTSKGWKSRWLQHVRSAMRGDGYLLHRAIRRYGPGSFSHEILACVYSDAEARDVEVECIAASGSRSPGGYNLTAGGDGVVGPAADVVARVRAKLLGVPKSKEHSARMGATKRGIPLSDEHKAKLGASKRGRTLTVEHRAKIGVANARRVFKESTREKQSAAKRGRPLGAAFLAAAALASRRRHARNRFARSAKSVWLKAEADLGIL